MNFKFKRLWAIFLAAVMLFTMMPSFTFSTSAATTQDFAGCSVADLDLSATNANGSGSGENAPVCSWTASGTNINGSLVGGQGKKLISYYYYESTSTLTLTNNKTSEAELSFKYSVTTSGSEYGDITVNGTKHTSNTTGEVSETLAAGDSITVVLHVPQRSKAFATPDPNGASISITDIKLVSQGNATVNFSAAENGSYTVAKAEGTAVTVPGSVAVKTTDRLTMTATPASGYVFSGWYNVTTGKYLSADLTYTTLFESDANVTAKFMKQADGVYGVGNAVFTDLTAAATAAAASSAKTVVLLKNATLTGSHTIPMGVTLLIPYDAAHTLSKAVPTSVTVDHSNSSSANYVKYEKPSAFRTLTMTDGSELIIEGEMSVNAKHESCVGGQIYGGQVLGKYGEIKMNGNSKITVKNGATVYAWGYIWGSGSVEALSGATIYEKMQVTDYRGGSNTSVIALRNGMRKSDGAFPFNQYYIQNIEVKEILHEGAKLMAHAAVNLAGETPAEAAVEFIGSSSAMFTVQGAVITKEYHPETDRLSLTVDGDENSYCEINGMKLSMGTLSIDSANYTLPINSNIDININAGAAVVNQELVLQPGVKVVVGSGAMLANNANVYIIDLDQWGNFVFSEKRQQAVVYTPSLNKASTRTINSDAVMDINGYVMTIAGVYTTAGGAQIISSEKTGMVEFGANAPTDSTVAQLTGGSDVNNIAVTSAKLKNGGLSGTTFVATKGASEGTVYSYCSQCDVWADDNHVCIVKYEITWKDKNGNTLYTEEVEEGTTPVFNNNNYVTVPTGHSLVYSPAIVAATVDAAYTVSANDCIDADKDHNCDYCSAKLSSHKDEDFDHICDYCNNSFSDHKDDDSNCICDYAGCKKQLDHNPGEAIEENRKEATCGEAGSYDLVVYCTVCKTQLSRTENTISATGKHTDRAGDKNHDCDVCGETNVSPHVNAAAVKDNVVNAGCEAEGSYDLVVYCSECGEEISRENQKTPSTGHKWNDTEYSWSNDGKTCTATRTCATDKSHVETKTATVSSEVTADPTCSEMGKTTYTATFDVDWAETQEITLTDVSTVNHKFENYAGNNDATCQKNETETAKCAFGCGETNTREIADSKVDHKYENYVGNNDATCLKNETETAKCAFGCGETNTREIADSALDHSFTNYVSDGNATCTEDGTKTAKCDRCEETDTVKDTGSALDHNYGEWTYVADGEHKRVCANDASHVETEPCADSDADDDCLCDKCKNLVAHSYDAATCDLPATCSVCGATTGDKLGHSFTNYVSDGNATCTEDGTKTAKCDRCEETDTIADAGSALDHSFTNYVSDGNATCTEDGTKTAKCDRCEVTDTVTDTGSAPGHSYSGVVTEPTCGAEGYTTYTCSACGDSYVDDYVETVDHEYESYVGNDDATCQKNETETAKCAFGCGAEDTREIANSTVDHKFENYVGNDDATCQDDATETAKCEFGCGETDTRDVAESKDSHKFVTYVRNNDATCQKNETETAKCAYGCGAEDTRDIENSKVDHKFENYIGNDDATCQKNATETADCEFGCGAEDTREIADSTVDHKFENYVGNNDATCQDDATETAECEFGCGETDTRDIAESKDSHKFVTYVRNNDATCQKNETETAKCAFGCGAEDTREIANSTVDHKFENYVGNNDATCLKNETETAKCAFGCGAEDTREIANSALGHGTVNGFDYDDNENGTHDVICKDCNETTDMNVDCSYDKTTHECDCGAVETFTVTLTDYQTERYKIGTLEVPYGAKILDYLKNVEVKDFDFDIGYMYGVSSFSGEWWDAKCVTITEEFTMPGEDITLFAYMLFTGWEHCGYGTWSYSIKSETQIGWIEIDGEWYYLAPNNAYGALRSDGITRAPYPTEKINGVTYGPDQETLDYCASKGVEFIDGETGLFVFGEDGKFLGELTGFVSYKDVDRYVENGQIKWNPGLVEVDGEIYYFVGDEEVGGNKAANGDTWIIRANGVEGFANGDIYNFKNGKLSGVNGISDGKYYENSKLRVGKGLV